MAGITYKEAGVDIETGNEVVSRIKTLAKSTFSPQVLNSIGGFAAMYDLKAIVNAYHHPVLVQSIDGVGTKIILAKMMQKWDTIGIDLVSATSNDIIVMGAKPLTLLDYIANDKLCPDTAETIIKGMTDACRINGVSLVGGETAEMPGTYLPGELDLVGIITGVLEKDRAILGTEIRPGDIVLCFASSGLHTNGFSLARYLLKQAQVDVHAKLDDFTRSIGEELLEPHKNYTLPILALLEKNVAIKGMAHITGGGLLENIPRILPKNCAVEIIKKHIPTLPIFPFLKRLGQLDEKTLYQTFNMGAGMVLVIAPEMLSSLHTVLSDFPDFPIFEIGQVVSGANEVRLL